MGAENFEAMSSDELEILVEEKKLDLKRAELELKKAKAGVGSLEEEEKRTEEEYEAAKKLVEEKNVEYDRLKSELDKDKAEAMELQSIIDTCNEEQIKAEEELHEQTRRMGISDEELESLDADLEKAVLNCERVSSEIASAQRKYDEVKSRYDMLLSQINDDSKKAKIAELKQELLLAVRKKAKYTQSAEESIRYQMEQKYAVTKDASIAARLAKNAVMTKFGQAATAINVGGYNAILLQDGSMYSYEIDGSQNVVLTALDRNAEGRPSETVSCAGEADLIAKTAGKREGIEYTVIDKVPDYIDVSYSVNASDISTFEAIEKYYGVPGLMFSYNGKTLNCTRDAENGVDELTYTDSMGNQIPVYVENGISVNGSVNEQLLSGDKYNSLENDANVSGLMGSKVDKMDVVIYSDVQRKECSSSTLRSEIEALRLKGYKEGSDYVVSSTDASTYTIVYADIQYEFVLSDMSFTIEGISSVINSKADSKAAYAQLVAPVSEIVKASNEAEEIAVPLKETEDALNRIKTEGEAETRLKDSLMSKKASVSSITKAYDEAKKTRIEKVFSADDKLSTLNEKIEKNTKLFADTEAEYKSCTEKSIQAKVAYDEASSKKKAKDEEVSAILDGKIPEIKKDISDIAKVMGKTLEDLIGPEKKEAPVPAPAPAPASTPAPAPTPAEAPAPAPSQTISLVNAPAAEKPANTIPTNAMPIPQPSQPAMNRRLDSQQERKEISLLGNMPATKPAAPAPAATPTPAAPAPSPAAAPTPAPAASATINLTSPAPAAEAPKPMLTPAAQHAAQAMKAEASSPAPAAVSAKDAAASMNADPAIAEMIKARKGAGNGTKVEVLQAKEDTAKVAEVFGSNGIDNYLIVPSEDSKEDTITVNSGTRFKLEFENPNILTEDGVASTWNRTKHAKIDNGGFISFKHDKGMSSYKVVVEGTRSGKPYTLTIKVVNLCFAVTLQSMKLDSFMSSVKISLLEINTYAVTELATAGWYVDGAELVPGVWVNSGKGEKPLAQAFLSPDNKTIEVRRIDGARGRVTVQAYMNGAEYHTPIQISEK